MSSLKSEPTSPRSLHRSSASEGGTSWRFFLNRKSTHATATDRPQLRTSPTEPLLSRQNHTHRFQPSAASPSAPSAAASVRRMASSISQASVPGAAVSVSPSVAASHLAGDHQYHTDYSANPYTAEQQQYHQHNNDDYRQVEYEEQYQDQQYGGQYQDQQYDEQQQQYNEQQQQQYSEQQQQQYDEQQQQQYDEQQQQQYDEQQQQYREQQQIHYEEQQRQYEAQLQQQQYGEQQYDEQQQYHQYPTLGYHQEGQYLDQQQLLQQQLLEQQRLQQEQQQQFSEQQQHYQDQAQYQDQNQQYQDNQYDYTEQPYQEHILQEQQSPEQQYQDLQEQQRYQEQEQYQNQEQYQYQQEQYQQEQQLQGDYRQYPQEQQTRQAEFAGHHQLEYPEHEPPAFSENPVGPSPDQLDQETRAAWEETVSAVTTPVVAAASPVAAPAAPSTPKPKPASIGSDLPRSALFSPGPGTNSLSLSIKPPPVPSLSALQHPSPSPTKADLDHARELDAVVHSVGFTILPTNIDQLESSFSRANFDVAPEVSSSAPSVAQSTFDQQASSASDNDHVLTPTTPGQLPDSFDRLNLNKPHYHDQEEVSPLVEMEVTRLGERDRKMTTEVREFLAGISPQHQSYWLSKRRDQLQLSSAARHQFVVNQALICNPVLTVEEITAFCKEQQGIIFEDLRAEGAVICSTAYFDWRLDKDIWDQYVGNQTGEPSMWADDPPSLERAPYVDGYALTPSRPNSSLTNSGLRSPRITSFDIKSPKSPQSINSALEIFSQANDVGDLGHIEATRGMPNHVRPFNPVVWGGKG